MTEEKRNLFYKLRYTGWGRILTFVLIIAVSSGFGYGIYSLQPKETKEEVLDRYIDENLVEDISNSIVENTSRITNVVNFGINYNYEKDKKESVNSEHKYSNLDKIKEKKNDLVYLKGEYTKEGIKLNENNLKNERVNYDIEDSLGRLLTGKEMEYVKTEVINSTDEDYIEKMRNATEFSVEDEGDEYRYGKGEYGSFEGNLSIREAKEIYGDDGVLDIVNSTGVPEGVIYPKGKVTLYENEIYKLENAEFVFTVDKNDVLNNPYFTNGIEKIIITAFLPAICLAVVLLLIFNGLSKYEVMRRVKHVRLLDKLYIDIFTITLFIPFILGLAFISDRMYLIRNYPNMSKYIILIAFLAGTTVIGLMIFSYEILVIKGLYNNGILETIRNKTLTFWIVRKIIELYKKVRMILQNQVRDVGTLGVVGSIVITAIAAFIVVFFSILLLNLNTTLWFFLGIIAIGVVYTLVYNISKNIKDINDKSEEIANGNYNVKVDESLPYFKNIAHNFNTIGDNLTTAVDEQVKAERMRTELITNVSHDLKTPLTSIINYSKILIDEDATVEEKEEYAQVIHEKALKLKTLIDDLFQISKASSNNIEFEYVKLDFSAMILQAIGEWKDNFEQRELNIVFNKPEYPVVIMLDGNRTYRVLDNLMGNIFKYAQENTRVYVDLSEIEGKVKLIIKNISAYELNISAEELMERFTRGDKSRSTDGSGLGLSIASSLIEGQGGIFDIEIDGDLFKISIEFNI